MEHSLVSNKCLHLYLPSCGDNFNPTPLQVTFFIYSKFSFDARARCNPFSRRWPEFTLGVHEIRKVLKV